MAKLNITLKRWRIDTQVVDDSQSAVLTIRPFVGGTATVDAASLISSDTPNALTIGSDNKLVAGVVDTQDIDFTAYYTLAKG